MKHTSNISTLPATASSAEEENTLLTVGFLIWAVAILPGLPFPYDKGAIMDAKEPVD